MVSNVATRLDSAGCISADATSWASSLNDHCALHERMNRTVIGIRAGGREFRFKGLIAFKHIGPEPATIADHSVRNTLLVRPGKLTSSRNGDRVGNELEAAYETDRVELAERDFAQALSLEPSASAEDRRPYSTPERWYWMGVAN